MDDELRRLRLEEGRKCREIAVAMARTTHSIEMRLYHLKIVVQPHHIYDPNASTPTACSGPLDSSDGDLPA